MKTLLLMLLAVAGLHAQTLVTITGPVNKSNGNGWTGKILLSNPDMICGSVTVTAGAQVLTVTNGALSAQIYATADCLPAGSSYLAEYTPADLSLPSRWVIPTSPTTIAVSAIQSPGTVKPDTTVALPRLGFGPVADGEFLKRVGNNWVGGAGGGSFATITGAAADNASLASVLSGKEPTISAGTDGQFLGWDKTWRTPTGEIATNGIGLNKVLTEFSVDNTVTPVVSSGAGPPVGACTGVDRYQDTTAHQEYYCEAGTWRAGGSSYTLPTATASVLGGIKIGSGLSIDGAGVVTASGGGGATWDSLIAVTWDAI